MRQLERLRHAAHKARLRVAIDGPAGAGKSTVGLGLAEKLECVEVDTGLMYRAVTRAALDRGVSGSNGPALAALAQSLDFSLGGPRHGLYINGAQAGPDLRSERVDAAVSEVSAHPEVRHVLVKRQRDLARQGCIVMIGRDIGTVVLRDAPVKLWITASPETRARRRLAEHLAGNLGEAEVLRGIESRDTLDTDRATSPLTQAPDAIVVETDRLTPEEAVDRALAAVAAVLKLPMTAVS